MRRLLVRLLDIVDGWRHPSRRIRAARRLHEAQARSVLFICHGNVCRSPYGEWVLRRQAGGLLIAESAGFIGPDRAPPDLAQEAARLRGVDHSTHRSKVVSAEMLQSADAVFVFDRYNVKLLREVPGVRWERVFWLGDFDPLWTGRRAIDDPWGRPLEDFQAGFHRIERCVEEVLRVITPAGAA